MLLGLRLVPAPTKSKVTLECSGDHFEQSSTDNTPLTLKIVGVCVALAVVNAIFDLVEPSCCFLFFLVEAPVTDHKCLSSCNTAASCCQFSISQSSFVGGHFAE